MCTYMGKVKVWEEKKVQKDIRTCIYLVLIIGKVLF